MIGRPRPPVRRQPHPHLHPHLHLHLHLHLLMRPNTASIDGCWWATS